MNRAFLKAVLLTWLYLLSSGLCADEEVKANVAISLKQDGDLWAGQQVTVNLDLKTTGFSFSGSHFNLPEVDGGFLMQTDTTTIKMSETLNGETWQIVRYPLALYPQKNGQLQIPPINVRFSTSAGFGSELKAFEFQTEPLEILIKLPPGAKEDTLLVTTTSFELDHDWQPQTDHAQTGDALTLTVRRQADDISAMLLPPLPVFKTDGLAAYPQAPEVNDKTNRGDLTGERTDSIIWVVEKPGTYRIPGIRFEWWDPNSRELKQQIVPGIDLEVLPSATEVAESQVAGDPVQPGFNYSRLLIVIVVLIMAILLWTVFRHRATRPAPDTEQSTFNTLQNACKSNKAGQSHIALHAWIEKSSPPSGPFSRPATLGEFAVVCGDSKLASELVKLQEALVSSSSSWQGSDLLTALQDVRGKIRHRRIVESKAELVPLNP